jgi:hypothetical protein
MRLRRACPGASPALAGIALLLLAGGCVEIRGGAVEVSWVVRSSTGAAITDCSCAFPPIATVRLSLVGNLGSICDGKAQCDFCEGQAQCNFPCQRQTGSTAFDIPPTPPGESYQISLSAVDSSGNSIAPTDVMAPAPILRTVVAGQPTETEAFQLVALGCGAECQVNGSDVCARP